ncbi:glycosyltransferase [Verrucomicrobiota bacterium]
MNDRLVIIPTYDEKDNVGPVSEAVFGSLEKADILFIDDNSPDGTGKLVDDLSAKDNRVHTLHNEQKAGLGRAYIQGFKWALEREYKLVFEMDADFSHDPAELPNFVKAAENADLILC